jgi:hypothetical protein
MGYKSALFVVALLSAAQAGAHTRIYTYEDADGVKHYTDIPDNNRYRLLVLSPHDLTESGEHYSASMLARASQYDSIIERAALSDATDAGNRLAIRCIESL